MTDKSKEVSYIQLLKNKYFLLYNFTGVFSMLANGLTAMAFILIAFGDMESVANVSYYKIAKLVPALLFGLIAGVYVDRWGKKKTYISTHLIGAIIILVPIFYRDIYTIVTVAIFLAVLSLFGTPAHEGLLPSLVNKRELRTANSFIRLTSQTAGIIAPTLAILLIDKYSFMIIFILDSVTYIIDAFALYLIPIDEEKQDSTPGVKGVISDIKEGFIEVKNNKIVITFFITGFVLVLGATPFRLYIIDYVNKLYATKYMFGITLSVAGLGGFIGSYFTGKFFKDISHIKLLYITIFSMTISFLFISLIPHYITLILGGLLFGFGNLVLGISFQSCIQGECKQKVLGRIFSTWDVLHNIGAITSFILATILLKNFGPEGSMFLAGCLMLTSVLVPINYIIVKRKKQGR